MNNLGLFIGNFPGAHWCGGIIIISPDASESAKAFRIGGNFFGRDK